MALGSYDGHMIELTPSILSADFANLQRDVEAAEAAGCTWLQADVMDGHFVPNLTFGPPVLKALRPHIKGYLDIHLMVSNPDELLEQYADAGANNLTVHWEACQHLHRTVQRIHELGCHAGVALNPATPVSILQDILPDVDIVLVMSVNPGFGGQSFIPQTLHKIRQVRSLLDEIGSQAIIQVDGGVKPSNLREIVAAGAVNLVAGSAFFSPKMTPVQAYKSFEAALMGDTKITP